MLRSIKDLIGYPIDAIDGRIGKVNDALFDDRYWRLRYIVVDTKVWVSPRKVLLSPMHLGSPETGRIGNSFPVDLRRDQVEKSPSISVAVSRFIALPKELN